MQEIVRMQRNKITSSLIKSCITYSLLKMKVAHCCSEEILWTRADITVKVGLLNQPFLKIFHFYDFFKKKCKSSFNSKQIILYLFFISCSVRFLFAFCFVFCFSFCSFYVHFFSVFCCFFSIFFLLVYFSVCFCFSSRKTLFSLEQIHDVTLRYYCW